MPPLFSALPDTAPRGLRGTLTTLALAWALAGGGMLGAHASPPTAGLLVQLRSTSGDDAAPVASLVLRDAPHVHREQARQLWEQRHARDSARLYTVAHSAGVTHHGVGTAGSWLKLDVSTGQHPQDRQDPYALEAAMRRLRLHPDVQAVVPNVRLQRQQSTPSLAAPTPFIPNDPRFSEQWSLQAPSQVPAGLNMPLAWGRYGGLSNPQKTVTVAVVDTGVRFDHPDLAGRLLPGYDFVSEVEFANDGHGRDADASDPGDWVTRAESLSGALRGCDVGDSTWHGTGIAGLIGARHSNGTGISGVHPEAQIVPVRVAGKCGASLSDLLDGVRWAAGLPVAGAPTNPHPARIINLSYGGSSACDSAYQTTLDAVRKAGALVVVAAGNTGGAPTRPADCHAVVSVTAVRSDGAKADYASLGSNVALAAPGGSGYLGNDNGLLTTLDAGRQGPISPSYGDLTGTSFAAPLAAGVAGLMLSAQPALDVDQLDRLLRQAVRPHTQQPLLSSCQLGLFSQGVCNCNTTSCGSGLLDADLAIQLAAATTATPTPASPTPVTPTPSSGGGGSTSIGWGGLLWLWVLAFAQFSRRKIATAWRP